MNYVLILGSLLILGLIASRVTKKAHMPNVTGYLVIGLLFAIICILVDRAGYQSPHYEETLSGSLSNLNYWVSTVALGFIALSIGQEFKLSQLKQFGGKIVLITLFQALLTTIVLDVGLALACYFLHLNVAIAICLGAIGTATAPAATLMVIHQYKAKGPLVDILLPVVAFDDAVGLIIFSVSVAVSKTLMSGSGISVISLLVIPLVEIFGSLAVGLLLGILMHFLIKIFESRNNHMIVIIAFTLLGVGACIALSHLSIAGEKLEFSSLLCCMMIGAVYVNFSKDDDKPIVTRDLELMDRWTPFLFTLFFVLSGAHLATSAMEIFSSSDNKAIYLILIVFGLYLVLRSLGKYFGAFLGSTITRQEPVIKKYLGLTLLPQAGVAIGMANQISGMESFQKDNIGNAIVTVVLCATLVYELVGPLITKWSLSKAGEIPEA